MSTETTATPRFPAAQAATDYIALAETDVKTLTRKRVYQLRDIFAQELAKGNKQMLFGGPSNKDELISAILRERYPYMQEAYEVRAADFARRHREESARTLARLLTQGDDSIVRDGLSWAGPFAREHVAAIIREMRDS